MAVGTTMDQGYQHQCVQALSSMHGKRICYRSPSKLVPKCNCIGFVSQDSAADAFFKQTRIGANSVVEQPHLSSGRND